MSTRVGYTFKPKDAAKPKSADLFLYDIIGDSWDGTTAKQFAMDLAALGVLEELNIFINSPGGVVWDGVAIYNQLVRSKATKNVYVDGVAASIASVVAMAGDKIVTAKNAMWMIHDPYASVFGARADEMRQIAARLDAIREVIKQTYTDRAGGKTKETQFGDWMKEEKWFSSSEALAAGLTDEVSEKEIAIAALLKEDDVRAQVFRDSLSKFKNVPEQLVTAVASAVTIVQPDNTSGAATRKKHPALVKANARMLGAHRQ